MTDQLTPQTAAVRLRRYYRVLEPFWQKPKNRAYTAAIFSFLAISLFGWYAIRPTIKTILFLRREIKDKTELNIQMENKISDLIEAQIAYQEIAERIPLLYEAAPQNPDAIQAALELNNMVSPTKATISALAISQDVPLLSADQGSGIGKKATDQLQNFSVNLISDGAYIDLEQVTRNAINMRRLVSLNGISIAPGKNSSLPTDNEGLLKMVMQVQSYYNP